MGRPFASRLAVRTAAILLFIFAFLSISPALAGPPQGDRKPPTRPRNLRVTATSAYTVSFTWEPSTDNSGFFTYTVVGSHGQTMSVPQSQSSLNWNFGLVPNNTYSFYVYATDAAGNRSQNSNTVAATLLPDTTPPTPPVVSLVDVNPTEMSLAWSASTDDGLHLMYQVYVNGVPNVDTRAVRTAVLHNLTPETTYEITVHARDLYGGNVSLPSNTVTVTTTAVDPNDTEAPPPPADFYALDINDCAEVWLFWTQSFDNQTPQAGIAYEVYVNGVLDDTRIGEDRAVVYGHGGDNSFALIAVDSAGNRSTTATATVSLCQ